MSQPIYWVSDGKLKPKPFFNIDNAVIYADNIKGMVLTIHGPNITDFNIIYSWGERTAMGISTN